MLASARLPVSCFHHRCLAKVEISSGRWLASSWKTTRTSSPSNSSRETAVLSLWGSLADSSMLKPWKTASALRMAVPWLTTATVSPG